MSEVEAHKRAAAQHAASLVQDGWLVGLGTGSTVAHLIQALARRRLRIRCIATSPATEDLAASAGLRIVDFDDTALDIAVDGADQISPDGWLVKGGGGAHTREKLVATAARRFVVIADESKLVERLHRPVPVELMSFGLRATLARLGAVELRHAPPTPDGGVLADWIGPFDDPAALASRLDATPGVVSHGLFPPEVVSTVLVGSAHGVQQIDVTLGDQ
ncbi:MAG: ribose-5-phosphate isomerase RpiA [Acidimicrobiales bacterium]